MLSQAFLPNNAADSLIIGWCHLTTLALPMMQGHQSLMLPLRCFLGHGSDVVESVFPKQVANSFIMG
jgi:hypothetical protein